MDVEGKVYLIRPVICHVPAARVIQSPRPHKKNKKL